MNWINRSIINDCAFSVAMQVRAPGLIIRCRALRREINPDGKDRQRKIKIKGSGPPSNKRWLCWLAEYTIQHERIL